MNELNEHVVADLDLFAAAVAHEVRTPLTAIASEIEVALRRDRSAEEYRNVLRRIVAPVAELVAISGDLNMLGAPPGRLPGPAAISSRVDLIVGRLEARYRNNPVVRLDLEAAGAARVRGDEQRLGRAIALVIDHAIRYRRNDARVSVHAMATDDDVLFVVHAGESGFWPDAWDPLRRDAAGPADPLRLRTARRIVESAGGHVALADGCGTDSVHVVVHRDA